MSTNSSKRKVRRVRKRPKKGGKSKKSWGSERNSHTFPLTTRTINNTFNQICPTEQDETLVFCRKWTSSGAAPAITKRFNPNSAWRPDPVSFAFSAVGFTDWATFYSLYRVIMYHYEVTVVNKEAFALVVYVTNSNADPSVSNSFSEAGNDLSQRRVISAKGGMDRVTIRKTYKVATVIGSDDVETDDDYRGLMSSGSETSPPDLAWLGVGVESISGVNLTNGAECTLVLHMLTRMYDRQILSQGTSKGGKTIFGTPLIADTFAERPSSGQ